MQIALGFPAPAWQDMPRLSQILRGVRVSQGRQGRSPRPRLPITPSILRKMKVVWVGKVQSDSYDSRMLWAAATTTFFTFCRAGEITIGNGSRYDPQIHLSFGDVAVDNVKAPSMVSLQLKQSKTDQIRQGVKVVMGKTGDDICPIAALLHYLSLGLQPWPSVQVE